MMSRRTIALILALLMLVAMIPLSASAVGFCVITFDANGAEGTMEPVTVKMGDTYTLPECGFTVERGRSFNGWDAGYPYSTITVNDDMTIKALWGDCDSVHITVSDDEGNAGKGGTFIYDEPIGYVSDQYENLSLSLRSFWLRAKPDEGYEYLYVTDADGTILSDANPADIQFDSFYPADQHIFDFVVVFKKSAETVNYVTLDLPIPKSGDPYDYHVGGTATVSSDAPYTVSRVSWFNQWGIWPSEETAFGDVEYFAEITLTAKSGYEFGDSVYVSVNGIGAKEAEVENYGTMLHIVTYNYDLAPHEYTLSLDPGEGSGTMEDIPFISTDGVTMPACTFTAPEGKVFDCWTPATAYLPAYPGDVVYLQGSMTYFAIWKDASAILGDVDSNGRVDIFDASAIQKSLAGMANYPKYDAMDTSDISFKIADVDKSGQVDIFDASLIQGWIAGDAKAKEYGIGEPI